MYTTSAVLQAATTIAKTTETLVGAMIDCEKGKYLTLFLDYTKGDETGLNVVPYFTLQTDATTNFPVVDWASAAGVYTGSAMKVQFTATAKRSVTIDVRGIKWVSVYQGGSNNDGTPTGTLAAYYTLKE